MFLYKTKETDKVFIVLLNLNMCHYLLQLLPFQLL